MPARSRRHRAETFLLASAVAVASLGAPLSGVRLHLPFELLPGAVYLGLLSWPAFLGGGEGGDGAADLQLAAYGGPAYTMASPVHFTQRGGTDLRFDAVHWKGQPFKPPPYYGLRGILWPANAAQGLMVDFTHIKAKARWEIPVRQQGMRDGLPAPAKDDLSATFNKLEFTHGYNLLTFNLVRRRSLGAQGLVAYAGAGAGVSIPHVEVGRAGSLPKARTSEYQVTGPAVQVLGGMEWRFAPHLSLFVEYKLSCSAISGDVKGGGRVETNLCTHQLLAGPAWHLQAPQAAVP
jgi:lipid A oxidase